MFYILKITTKFGFALQTFCQDQDPDKDKDHDFNFEINTWTTRYLLKIPTKVGFDPQIPSKVIVSTDGYTDGWMYGRTGGWMDGRADRWADRPIDGRTEI